jgi:UDP-glucose 4-epimerase
MSILVTGGTGYIGSHTVIELLNKNEDVVIIDNLSNSNINVLDKIYKITNKKPKFYKVDLLNNNDLENIFKKEKIDLCIHFAGLKSVSESINVPIQYYENNVLGTINLLNIMNKYNCKKIIFSSSATVYGNPKEIPISENCPKGICTNAYGWTKSMIEQILTDLYQSDKNWSITILRYFNPIGAHTSGIIGEEPNGIPNNLMPYITQVAIGKLECLKIFGNDYDTIDGTGVRDYIHVVDLALGHIACLYKLKNETGINIYNLGTGNGYSVLEILKTFEKINKLKIPYEIIERRPGDIPICFCDPSKALKELGWSAKYNIEDMCKDSWNWELNNYKQKK